MKTQQRPVVVDTAIHTVDRRELASITLDEVAAVVILARLPAAEPHVASPATAAPPSMPPSILRIAASRLGLRLPDESRRTPKGRPYLVHRDGTRWEVDFNISHSGELIGVALGVGGQLGLDIQRLPDRGWERIGRRWLHADEWARVADRPSESRCREFSRAWAIREARCKATGLGLAGFRSPQALSETTAGTLDGVAWRELPAPADYTAALAWVGPSHRDWFGRPVVISWEKGRSG